MPNVFTAGLLILFLTFCVAAQKIEKPTLTPQPATAEQNSIINEGVRLHDLQKYDEAIKKYEQALKANPDCTRAIYELAYTYFAKPDFPKGLEIASLGTKYKSGDLPLFYVMIANHLDDHGDSGQAIKLYRDGIKIVSVENNNPTGLSSLYYNLAVTLLRQKQPQEARESLKNAVIQNPLYSSPHYLLAQEFFGKGYQIPALLAAARLISLEVNTDRTRQSVAVFNKVLLGGVKRDAGSKNITITVASNAPKDEGDFSGMAMTLGLFGAGTEISDENKDKSDEEKYIDKINGLIEFLDIEKKTKTTFVGKNYFPFMLEMKSRGFVPAFGYLILQQSGNQAGEKWVLSNSQKVIDLLAWAKRYKPAN